jgi:murein DD-endopeptidase MepM/ murein hydrolase activator NlpD
LTPPARAALAGARAGRFLALALAAVALAACPRPPHRRPPPARPEREAPPPVRAEPGRPPATPERGGDAGAAPPSGGAHVEPDVVGVVHVVRKGETLYRIARAYGMTAEDLAEVNGVRDPRALEVGDELFVPGAVRAADVAPAPPGAPSEPEPAVSAAPPEGERPGRLLWPLKGVLYSKYGPRQGQHHDGIDIAAPSGTLVTAAAAGKVVYAGEQPGYGSIVILRHPGGLLTVYAHASALLVREGEAVDAGAPVARVGQSGRTTGPHLHFEVREGTRPRDPLRWLRPGS